MDDEPFGVSSFFDFLFLLLFDFERAFRFFQGTFREQYPY